MAKFDYAGQLNGAANPVIRNFLIANSADVAVGEALSFSSGALTATGGDKVLGICIGIVDSNGIDMDNTSQTLDGTWVSSTKTYTAADDNVTVLGVRAQCICDKNALFKNDSDGSITVVWEGEKFNLASGTQIDASTHVVAAGQFELVKHDPEGTSDASMGTFKICESYGDAYVQQ